MNQDLTVAIPTLNSGRYLDIILEYYRQGGIPVTVFVDDASTDDTLAVARRLAANAVTVRNARGFIVEGLVEQISRHCRTPWMLRIDDDELPTVAMMEFVQKAISEEGTAAYGFARHQCAVCRSGRLLDCIEISPLTHVQWRLYQPALMIYVHDLHTPGFVLGGSLKTGHAPSEAKMIHLDWAVHTYDERKRKVERYDAHLPNEGTKWRSYYLYEEQASCRKSLVEMPLPEFGKTCAEISRRFQDL